MWEKFRKINGNCTPRIVPSLDRGESIITSPDEIADTFADHYVDISKDQANQRETEIKREKNNNHLQTELKAAINQQKNTAPGEDTIHPG